jgi:tetratricopeptide (TPR) repeat protein
MTRLPGAPIAGALGIVLAVSAGIPLAADTIHLRNGGSIEADAWRYEGDLLLVRQRGGTIAVPRQEVVRIDPSPVDRKIDGAPAASQAAAGAAAPAPRSAEVREAAAIPERDLPRAAEEVRRQIRDYPLARVENTRRLVSILNQMAAAAYRERRYDEALVALREALSLAPHDHDAQEGLAATHLALGQDRQARAVLDQALLDHPEDSDLLALQGDLLYGQEKPQEALIAWQKAETLRPDPALRKRIEKLQRELTVEDGYRRSEAAHFTLKYDGARTGADLETAILDYLESEFWDLARRFDYQPGPPIVVIVYPERQFHEATLAESNVAGLYDGKIRVPIGGLRQLHDGARRVLLHELAHAFVAGKTRFTAPRWLQEGIAQMVEGSTTNSGTGGALARSYRGIEDKSQWAREFSYPSALSFVEFIVEREGFYRLVDVLEEMGGGADVETAFRTVTRSTLADLRDEWGRALELRHLH